jgi:hypothetical protein
MSVREAQAAHDALERLEALDARLRPDVEDDHVLFGTGVENVTAHQSFGVDEVLLVLGAGRNTDDSPGSIGLTPAVGGGCVAAGRLRRARSGLGSSPHPVRATMATRTATSGRCAAVHQSSEVACLGSGACGSA